MKIIFTKAPVAERYFLYLNEIMFLFFYLSMQLGLSKRYGLLVLEHYIDTLPSQ